MPELPPAGKLHRGEILVGDLGCTILTGFYLVVFERRQFMGIFTKK